MSAGLLDTSVFVATESGRPADLTRLPEMTYISVVTLAELHAGVLAADDTDTRSHRLETVEFAASFQLLQIDEGAARQWARLRVQLRDAGRSMKINDLWIASIASAHGFAVVTQDPDFHVLAELGLVAVVRI